jgi:hypothetical protein
LTGCLTKQAAKDISASDSSNLQSGRVSTAILAISSAYRSCGVPGLHVSAKANLSPRAPVAAIKAENPWQMGGGRDGGRGGAGGSDGFRVTRGKVVGRNTSASIATSRGHVPSGSMTGSGTT